MRIAYVSQYFPPEMGAPAARVSELSREWVRGGHEVTVLTGTPHHPTGVVPDAYRGGPLIRRERFEGVEVIRAPLWASANRGVVRRSLTYASWAASASLLGPLLVRKPDVVIATTPQILAAGAGLWLARALRVPFVLEVRDLWPRSIVEVGALPASSPAVRALEGLERLLYRAADGICVVSEAFVDHVAAHGGRRGRIEVVTNGVDLELFRPLPRDEARRALGLPAGFLASYVGTHGMAHGLGLVLDVASRLRSEPFHFVLAGEGAEKAALRERAAREGLANVTFLDQRPRDDVARLLAASDCSLVVLRDLPLFRTVIPSKIFECLGAARAVVSTVDGECRRILDAAGAGVHVPPEDPEALAAALRALAADPARRDALGRSGRAWAEANVSRAALARRYASWLAEVVAGA